MARRSGRAVERVNADRDAAPAEGGVEVDFDITIVGGEHGRRLATLQAEAVLGVLTWLHDHHRAGSAVE